MANPLIPRRSVLVAGAAGVGAAGALGLGVRPDRALAGEPSTTWVRSGGAGLALDRTGRPLAATTLGGATVRLGAGSGLFLREPVSGTQYAVVPRSVRGVAGGIEIDGNVPALTADVRVVVRPRQGGVVDVDGVVIDRTGTDRVLDTVFTLVPELTTATWQGSVIERVPLGAGSAAASQVAFPLACLVDPDSGFGLAYAIAPDRPCQFELSAAPQAGGVAVSVRQLWGLSTAAGGALRGRAPFGFTVDLGVDPDTGFRSALGRYHARSPEWFMNPAGRPARGHPDTAYGTWQYVPRSYYSEPTGLAFHPAGRGKGSARSVPEYGRNDEWSADEAAGVRTLPYTMPGQAEITDLPSLPADYDAAIAAYQAWTHAPSYFGACNGPDSYQSSDQLKTLIRNCGVQDPAGHYEIEIRNTQWGGNSVTFPTNPSPHLYADDDRLTTARYLLDYYLPRMLADGRVDGLFSDSLFEWGRFMNYRRDHFRYARIPLSYATTTTKYGTAYVAGLKNDFSQLEYLWELRSRLHARGKILMTNGVRAQTGETRAFDAFASDLFGAEVQMSFLLANESYLAFVRELALHKPVMAMIYDGWDDAPTVDAVWKRCLLYGVVPGSAAMDEDTLAAAGPIGAYPGMTDVEIAAQRRYLPALRSMLGAGWEPQTGLAASAAGVHVERYGGPTDFYLAVLNTGADATTTFTVDRRVVPGIDARRVTDVLSGGRPPRELVAALAGRGTVSIPADDLTVLHFGRS